MTAEPPGERLTGPPAGETAGAAAGELADGVPAAELADGVPAAELAAAALALARAYAAGATLWCVAPPWPSHGRHVAVEFVHPVVVGAKALPAVHVEAEHAADTLRLLAAPGDVLLVVGPGDDARAADLLRRAEAWGLLRIALGAGRRPAHGGAEHVVWLEGADPALAARSGEVVLAYHLLWELTQVVFEHPGLLRNLPAPPCAAPPGTDASAGEVTAGGTVCITCSDEGRVAEVRTVLDGSSAEVLASGRVERVDVTLVEPVAPGDLVLCHAGVAISLIGPESEP